MTKKLFTVHRNCYATIDIEVAAESEEEAIKLAESRFEQIPAKEYCFNENEVSVIDTKEMPDVDELIEEVTERLQEEEEKCLDDYSLPIEPVKVHITSLDWDEEFCISEEVEHVRLVDQINCYEGGICVQFTDSCLDEIGLEELDKPDQLAVLLKAQEKLNSLT